MDPETLRALQCDIAHWEAIADGKSYDDGLVGCRLCEVYDKCEDCPVGLAVGGCPESPYGAWCEHWRMRRKPVACGPDRRVVNARTQDLAIEWLSFLQSLLPEEE